MDDIVTNSIKTLNKVIRIFKEKDQTGILKIANQVKSELTEYQPFVPLALALRKDGMKERHWDLVTKKVGFKVEPYEGFTF
jgi:dynein heavy chain